MTINRYQTKSGIGIQSDISSPSSMSKGIMLYNLFDTVSKDNRNLLNIDKSVGTPTDVNTYEVKYNNYNNSINMPMLVNIDNGFNLFNSFFQNTYVETENAYYFYPYTFDNKSDKADYFMTILLDMKSRSRRMIGAVCNRMILGFTNDFMIANSNFIGREVEDDYNSSGESYSIPDSAILNWEMGDVFVGNSYLETGRSLFKNINISLSNNLVPKKYNNDKFKKYILGNIIGNGSFVVPIDSSIEVSSLDITEYVEDNDIVRICLKWGDSDNYIFEIYILAEISKVESANGEEQNTQFSYKAVEDRTFTDKIDGWSVDSDVDNIIQLTLSDNTVLTDNVVVGDFFSVGGSTYIIQSIEGDTIFKVSDVSGLSGTETNPMILRHPINVKVNKI